MSDDVRGVDESNWQDEEIGLEDDEYFDEDDLDLTDDDLAVIGSMGWEAERIECSKGDRAGSTVAELRSRWLLTCPRHVPLLKGRVY